MGTGNLDHLARRRLSFLHYVYSPYKYTSTPVAEEIDATFQNLFFLTKAMAERAAAFCREELFNISVTKIN